MGQLTREFVENIVKRADEGKHSPLTVWEEKQLALAWLERHDRMLSDYMDRNAGATNPRFLRPSNEE